MSLVIVGIIPIGGGVRDDYPLVQSRCYYNVVDVYMVATIVQDYASNSTFNRDVEYVFPLPPGAAVCAFKAVLDDKKTIKGVVKEKKEAKREFDAAVAQGKTAGLLQQEHADVFRVSLGNIKPKQKISVHISFVSIIPHDGSSPQTLRITMPTAIAPRYGAPPTNIPWFGTNSRSRFELSVAVQMNKAITSVSSPSHPIGLTLGCAQKELKGEFEPSKAFVYLSDQALLDKDIIILISAQGLDTPRCTVERWLTSDGAEETTDAYALTLVPKFDLPALPRQEYIFLVDRSGSMGTGRMDSVKASLQIMLKSLPSRNTIFNIVSFGSSYSSLWPTSRAYSAESVEEASKHVDTFTSNYGGTEIRSALEFAFSSRIAHGKTNTEDKIPASVFVLTDGEAWDLQRVVDTVSNRLEEAKKKDCLLRTFVLGVGNQVSTAMCEGIARAGKGVATFVAEGEKPDTKLMNLLKAARGGVIEDLSVDWGVVPNEEDDGDVPIDDFEMVEEPSAQAAPPSPPINLFDDNMVDTSTSELGPEKAIVNLPPPPLVQQAPKSDKLPIPLYPGFRCSIFAIIKQPSNPGTHSSYVKITGKVLGKDVVLQLPVTPISIGGETTKDAVEGGRLLHTLAAKALIQLWEDMSSTPETKAQIERLGKRYTLASSVTSFLAIDEETNDELHSAPQGEALQNLATDVDDLFGPVGSQLDPSMVYSKIAAMPNLSTLSGYSATSATQSSTSWASSGLTDLRFSSPSSINPYPDSRTPAWRNNISPYTSHRSRSTAQPQSHSSWSSNSITGFSEPLSSAPSSHSYGSPIPGPPPIQPQIVPSSTSTWYSKRPQQAQQAQQAQQQQQLMLQQLQHHYIQQQQLQQMALQQEAEVEPQMANPMSAPMPPADSMAWRSSAKRRLASATSRPTSNSNGGVVPPFSSYDAPDLVHVGWDSSPMPMDSFSQPMDPNNQPIGSRTVASLARAQNFDGSFPSTVEFSQMLFQSRNPLPDEPSELVGVVTAEMRKSIWITILTLACLKKVFGGEKDAWEVIADKGQDFVENALMKEGVAGSVVQSVIAQLMLIAENSF